MKDNKIEKRMYPQYLIIPAAIIYVVFFLGPNLTSFYYSFTNWNAYSQTMKFIGLDHFREIFSSSSGDLPVMIHTLIFTVYTTVLKIVFGLFLALLLNEKIRTKTALRAIFYMPITLPIVLLGIMFSQIYSPEGLINAILNGIGLSDLTHAWIADPDLAIWSIATVEVWRASGFAMAIFLAALQMIPKEIYEAAEIDGAGPFQRLFYIVCPYLYQAFVICTLLGMISGMKVFDLVFVITNGGPGRSSEVLNVTILNEFSKGSYGLSTAMGLILFLVITISYFIVNSIFKRFEVDVT
ncbi:sugar ABC transporter permease [Paenibacillus sp. HB172176]|uniref:carbohydrate ABC transporter permease n=1 Tax=Paenibacillus sp. HB172176 TaxID=2493690 RepID=UPI001F112E11|nr:sugar ABC transporter permease [Paenibacillus sp. HB172176]